MIVISEHTQPWLAVIALAYQLEQFPFWYTPPLPLDSHIQRM